MIRIFQNYNYTIAFHNNELIFKYEGWGEHSYNPLLDKLFELNHIKEVKYVRRFGQSPHLYLKEDYPELYGKWKWFILINDDRCFFPKNFQELKKYLLYDYEYRIEDRIKILDFLDIAGDRKRKIEQYNQSAKIGTF